MSIPALAAESNPSAQAMPAEAAEAVCARVLYHLCRGSIEYAREALEAGWQSHLGEQLPLPTGPALLDEPLARVIDDQRLLNMLEREGMVTVRQLLERQAGWAYIEGMGTKYGAYLANQAAMLRLWAKGVA